MVRSQNQYGSDARIGSRVIRSRALLELQAVDSERDAIVEESRRLLEALRDDSAVAEAAARAAELTTTKEEAGRHLGRLTSEREALVARIEEDEKVLYAGRFEHPKEVQNLQASIESHKRRLQALEEEVLEHMLARDAATEALTAAESELQAARQAAAQNRTELMLERESLRARVGAIEERKARARANVSDADLHKYDRLRAQPSLRGIAVTQLREASCGTCGSELPSQLLEQARAQADIVTCPACGRIVHA